MGRDFVVPADCPLTELELRTIAWTATGRSRKQVGVKLGVVPSTVRNTLVRVNRKLGTPTASAAAIMCFRRGWFGHPPEPVVDPPPPENTFERAYLEAFDEHLRTRSEGSRRAMRCVLMGMQARQDLPVTARRSAEDPLDRLLRLLTGP
jgi:DNA-binding CsgD family transcriptional regulator